MLKIRMSSPRLQAQTPRRGFRVAIIGGGYTGAIAAKLLVERGVRDIEEVTVFEPRKQLGWLHTSATLTVDPDAVTPEGIFCPP